MHIEENNISEKEGKLGPGPEYDCKINVHANRGIEVGDWGCRLDDFLATV